MEALFLVNPNSGSAEKVSRAKEVLQAQGVRLIVPETATLEEAQEAVRTKCRNVDLIVVAGGDGTLSGLAAEIAESGKPMGILPTGTANDLARTLGLPMEAADAASMIMSGECRSIDLGMVNQRPFLNVASIGVSSKVPQLHQGPRKRRLGVFSYPLSLWEAYRRSRSFSATIDVDGTSESVRAVQLAVGNGRHYGGGMTVHEEARIDDGTLRLYCIPPGSFWQHLGLMPALRFGALSKTPMAQVYRGKRIRVETKLPLNINVDGEIADKTPAVFQTRPGALRVIVPKSGAPGLAKS